MSVENEYADLSREELREKVVKLEGDMEAMKSNFDRIFQNVIPMLKERLDGQEEEIASVEALAQNAIGIAQTEVRTEESGSTKKGTAVRLIRRRLIKDAYGSKNSKSAVTTSMAQEMAEPDLDIARRTIHDAFDSLADSWDAFEHEQGTPGPNGDESKIKCDGELVEPALIRAVANNLTNEEHREALIMRAEEGGGV